MPGYLTNVEYYKFHRYNFLRNISSNGETYPKLNTYVFVLHTTGYVVFVRRIEVNYLLCLKLIQT